MSRGRPPVGTPEERLERKRRQGRERYARMKRREETGAILVPVQIDHVLVGLALEAGAVDEAGSRNRNRLARAIVRIATNALITAVASGRKLSSE
ncbi:MAG: hypothetical protein E5V65_08455 [Mesorhizobium sp.]|nr:MAG: hypothetical protein E5V65_08455 [Mesorhizobium sp.]